LYGALAKATIAANPTETVRSMPDLPEAHQVHIPFLRELLIFLLTAVVVVPVSRALRISPILGFLAFGVVVGPSVLGLASNERNIEALAELGVVFLLFTIGLDLSFDRLWNARRLVFGLGGLQLLACGAAIGGIALAWGNGLEASVLLGLSLALSSTAVVMQLLIERGQISSRPGRAAFSVLLFQDLAVVPLLFLVGVFAADTGGARGLALALGEAVAAVAAIVLLGRLLLRPLFRALAALRSPEVFMGLTLLAVLGTAVATAEAGLSMALGAFLAGLLLGESEFRHQVDADIQPFKGLLLGLFFISVGLKIDLSLVADRWGWVLAAVFGLYALKTAIIAGLALAWRFPWAQALRIGLYLGQGGEFAFVVIGAAVAAGVLAADVSQFMLLVTGLGMILTPFASLLGDRIARRAEARAHAVAIGGGADDFRDLEDHVVIAGFGRVGQTVGRVLASRGVPYVALDLNSRMLADLHRAGLPVYFGDCRRPEVLETVRAGRASALVVTLDDADAARQTLAAARGLWPSLPVFARAKDMGEAGALLEAGASVAVPEMVESSLQLAAEVLTARGLPEEAVSPLVEAFRDEIYGGIRRRPGS
jgi:monovalent cation:proton antiporter-2 (CPA2) family protein